MAKNKLASLALIGINVGLMLVGCSNTEANMTGEMKSFYEMLDSDARKKFLELDVPHRQAAMSITEQAACRSENECKGTRERAVQQQYDLQKQGS